jgi:hypothetical protein
MLEILTLDHFTALVGETFRVQLGGDTQVDLVLSEVTALSAATTGTDKRNPFGLVFRHPGRRILPQSVYALEHPKLGRLEIFIVPIGPDAGGMRYEAIFT